jgi:spore coat protein U-like protein
MIVRRLTGILILLVASFWAGVASAACYSPGACSCSVSLTSIAFGSYDTQSPGPTDTVGSLSISCSSGNPADSTLSIALSPGSSGNANARTLLRGTHPLYYNLYTNVARTVIWGDDSGGGESVASSFPPVSRTAKTFSIYGRIPALQNAWAGAYYDSVTVTVSY